MTRKLFHKIEGSGTPLLLIHGFTGSHKSFDKISNFLKIYFRVITIDMIGHGKSMDYKKENYSFDQSIHDISSIILLDERQIAKFSSTIFSVYIYFDFCRVFKIRFFNHCNSNDLFEHWVS